MYMHTYVDMNSSKKKLKIVSDFFKIISSGIRNNILKGKRNNINVSGVS